MMLDSMPDDNSYNYTNMMHNKDSVGRLMHYGAYKTAK